MIQDTDWTGKQERGRSTPIAKKVANEEEAAEKKEEDKQIGH